MVKALFTGSAGKDAILKISYGFCILEIEAGCSHWTLLERNMAPGDQEGLSSFLPVTGHFD